ncbi:uncharacterized protein [Oscarella lobularis]|uniref:uncharacterized protein isoform X2 n=1 Tax=Oscarella lobularis TaxID=121494 RepID=UPI00331398F7
MGTAGRGFLTLFPCRNDSAQAYCGRRDEWIETGNLYSISYLQNLPCAVSVESLATLQAQQEADIIDDSCLPAESETRKNVFIDYGVQQVIVLCSPYFRAEIQNQQEAYTLLASSENNNNNCNCLKRAAAMWSLGLIDPSEYTYKCKNDFGMLVQSATGENITTNLCNTSSPCISAEWRIEMRWNTSDDLDLIIRDPNNDFCFYANQSDSTICTGNSSAFTWKITTGPNVQSGGEIEYATISLREGVPDSSLQFFVYVHKVDETRLNIPVEVTWFLGGIQLGSVTTEPADSAPTPKDTWLGILDLSEETPNFPSVSFTTFSS